MISIQWLNGRLKMARVLKKGKSIELRDYQEMEIPQGDFWNRGLEEKNLVQGKNRKIPKGE